METFQWRLLNGDPLLTYKKVFIGQKGQPIFLTPISGTVYAFKFGYVLYIVPLYSADTFILSALNQTRPLDCRTCTACKDNEFKQINSKASFVPCLSGSALINEHSLIYKIINK